MAHSQRYKDLMAQKYLKDSIITQSQAIYGKNHLKGHDWTVITEKSKAASDLANDASITYRAHVIVYTSPKTLRDWTPLESTTKPCASETEALETLMSDLQEEMARLFEREYRYDEDTVVGSEAGVEEVAAKQVEVEQGGVTSSESSHAAATSKSMDNEEMFVDISDEENDEGHTISSSSGRFEHESSAPFAETPFEEMEAGSELVQGRNEQRIDEGYSGTRSRDAEKSFSTEEERVEDLVYESDEEPPAKRPKVVKKRGFGGC